MMRRQPRLIQIARKQRSHKWIKYEKRFRHLSVVAFSRPSSPLLSFSLPPEMHSLKWTQHATHANQMLLWLTVCFVLLLIRANHTHYNNKPHSKTFPCNNAKHRPHNEHWTFAAWILSCSSFLLLICFARSIIVWHWLRRVVWTMTRNTRNNELSFDRFRLFDEFIIRELVFIRAWWNQLLKRG